MRKSKSENDKKSDGEDEDEEAYNTDSLIRQLGGCARFQVRTICLAYLPYTVCAYTIVSMVFSTYNPGWRCMDDHDLDLDTLTTNTATNITTTNNSTNITTTDTINNNGIVIGYKNDDNGNNSNDNNPNYNPSVSTNDGTTTTAMMRNGNGNVNSIIINATINASMTSQRSMILTMTADNNNQTSSSALPGFSFKFQTDTSSCRGYATCRNVQFDPEVATVVSEFGLVCDKAWIVSVIVSVQMAGMVVGCLLTGYLGDNYGRRVTIYTSLLLQGALNVVSVFSGSWQTFVALRFFVGVFAALPYNLCLVYVTEIVPPKWRVVVDSLPMWATGSVLATLIAFLTKDWKAVFLINAALSFIVFLPVCFVPESVRWLIIKGKKEKAQRAVRTMATLNNVEPPMENLLVVMAAENNSERSRSGGRKVTISPLTLFGKRDTRMYALVVGFQLFCSDLIYYALILGIRGLPGNYFVSSLITHFFEFPASIACYLPNKVGRKITAVASYLVQSACFVLLVVLTFAAEGTVRQTGILACIVIGKTCLGLHWYVVQTYNNELFPTEIRSTAVGFGKMMAGIGSVVSPYLIPSDPSVLYISYVIMAVLGLVAVAALLLLPETNDTDLADRYHVSSSSDYAATAEKEEEEKEDDRPV